MNIYLLCILNAFLLVASGIPRNVPVFFPRWVITKFKVREQVSAKVYRTQSFFRPELFFQKSLHFLLAEQNIDWIAHWSNI